MEDPRTQPLIEWNRLSRENTENAIVSSMFEAGIYSFEPAEKVSTWLLLGVTAIASFLIANSEKLIPMLGKDGFLICGAALCLSCLFGILAKLVALKLHTFCKLHSAITKTLNLHFEKHSAEETQIKQHANLWNLSLETNLRPDVIFSKYSEPLPWWIKHRLKKKIQEQQKNPHAVYHEPISRLTTMGYLIFLQSITLLAFLVCGFSYATINNI